MTILFRTSGYDGEESGNDELLSGEGLLVLNQTKVAESNFIAVKFNETWFAVVVDEKNGFDHPYNVANLFANCGAR